jgi:hypothetical protein
MRMFLLSIFMLTATAFGQSIDVSITVDFGRDTGQNFGTLFEAQDSDGRLVYGAGFSSVYNTYHRGERYKVQFFIRPSDDAAYDMQRLPRFSDDTGTYLYPLGDEMIARGYGDDYGKPVVWNEATGAWDWIPADQNPGYGPAQVRGKVLTYKDRHLFYDGRLILPAADVGRYGIPYYGQGHLQFYHTHDAADDAEDFIRAVAVPWSPYDDDLTVDMSKAVTMDIKFLREFAYSWGQLGDITVNCSNWGGVYAFNGKQWSVVVEADDKTSYQGYAMINYRDKLYMAQYPTGFLFEFDGDTMTVLNQQPPVPANVTPSAREAQTVQIYRGELFVGVWPWSELWRLDPDTQSWSMLQRMFTHPQPHTDPVHPYEQEAKAADVVINIFGQRLTSLAPLHNDLFITTSSKDGSRATGEPMGFLSESQRDEYGTVYRMTMPGNLAAVMTWKDQPTTLRFVADGNRMAVYQDGTLIAENATDVLAPIDLSNVTVTSGAGVFGPLVGAVRAFESQ